MMLVKRCIAAPLGIGVGMLSGLTAAHPAGIASISQAATNEATIYEPGEVNCRQSASDREFVLLDSGAIQEVGVYCQTAQAQRQQPQTLRGEFPWSQPYRSGEDVCRDRSIGEIVCVSPSAADNLSWPLPLR